MPTFDSPEPIAVTLELGVGNVAIVASDRTDTVVEIAPSDPGKRADVTASEQTVVELADGRLLVRSPKGWRQWSPVGPRGGESIDVRIELPAGSRVEGHAGVASLRCTGRLGACRYRTGVGDVQLEESGPVDLRAAAGDVAIERVVGRAEVSTAGRVSIRAIDGPATVKNKNGDTWIGEVTGDVAVNAANGQISIDRALAGVTAKTANGSVRVGEVARGAVQAQSAFGTVEVGVREGVAAWLDLSTKFGHVRNELAAVARPDPGEDAVEVSARTSFGDVAIRRADAAAAGREDA